MGDTLRSSCLFNMMSLMGISTGGAARILTNSSKLMGSVVPVAGIEKFWPEKKETDSGWIEKNSMRRSRPILRSVSGSLNLLNSRAN